MHSSHGGLVVLTAEAASPALLAGRRQISGQACELADCLPLADFRLVEVPARGRAGDVVSGLTGVLVACPASFPLIQIRDDFSGGSQWKQAWRLKG